MRTELQGYNLVTREAKYPYQELEPSVVGGEWAKFDQANAIIALKDARINTLEARIEQIEEENVRLAERSKSQ